MSYLQENKPWTEALPSLFNLLVENSDRIIDDTILERVLEWLKTVCHDEHQRQKLLQCGTLEFLSSEKVFFNFESSAFFLRLFGLLASGEDVFNTFLSVKDGEFLTRFLDWPKNVENLWVEGIVRNGYFEALISLTDHKGGIEWLNSTDHVNGALDYITDQSMFVASSARSFIATYLIQQRSLFMSINSEELLEATLDDKNIAHMTEKLKSKLSQESPTFPFSAVAVMEIARMMISKNSVMAQKLLKESKILFECLGLIKSGDEIVCQKLVDTICETAKNSRTWELDWCQLLGTEDSRAPKILLSLCLDVFKTGFISYSLELIAGLSCCHKSSRDFPSHWLVVLCDIMDLILELVLNPCCPNGEDSANGYHIEEDSIGLVDGLLSLDEQIKHTAKLQVQNILTPWIKGKNSHIKVICQTLASAQQLMKQSSPDHCSYILGWVKYCLKIVENSADPSKVVPWELEGNQKVLKACLELFSTFSEVESSKDLLGSTDTAWINELFDELIAALLQLIQNSDINATVISLSLKTLGKVLDSAKDEFITELFSRKDENLSKRARLESPAPEVEHLSAVDVKRANRDKLAFLLFRRLRDLRWEVRDSTLEFVESLLRLSNNAVYDFLCFHNVPTIVWDAIDDFNSYVRASAIHVIGLLACQSQLWSFLLNTGRVTEESILEKLVSVVEKDDEAFPRRNAVECFTLWIQTRHPMTKRILRTHDLSRRDDENTPAIIISNDGNFTEGNQTFSDVRNVCELNQALESSKLSEFVPRLCCICQDFDWEVKLRGLEFWHAIIGYLSKSKEENERVKSNATESFLEETSNWDGDQVEGATAKKFDELCQSLFDIGALGVLIAALDDCDHLVCEKALEILGNLQFMAYPDKRGMEKSIKTLRDFQDKLGEPLNASKCLEVLRMTDFHALTQSIEAADSTVRADPVSLIEDILTAASQRDENLLDCY